MAAERTVRLLAGLLLAVSLLPLTAHADGPEWQQLTPEQRDVLGDFRDRWQTLPAERREHLIHRAERWRNLPPERREAVRERWEVVRQMPPEERQALRQRWESMSPDERRRSMEDMHHRRHEGGR